MQSRLPPTASSAPPITIATTPAQTGTLTVCFSLTDNVTDPIVASWVFWVKLKLPYNSPRMPAAISAMPAIFNASMCVLQRSLGMRLGQLGGFVATQVLSLGQGTFEFAASLLITPYLSFFLIRDGDRIVRARRQKPSR